MSLIPWKRNQPSQQLSPVQQDMQRMFDRFFRGFPAFPGMPGFESFSAFPAINVSDTGDAVCVKAEIPGLDADDVEISVEGNVLTLKGEKKEEKEEKKEDFYHVERSFGTFMRRVELPSPVDSNKAEARLDRGVLNLRLPKIAAESSRTIKVNKQPS